MLLFFSRGFAQIHADNKKEKENLEQMYLPPEFLSQAIRRFRQVQRCNLSYRSSNYPARDGGFLRSPRVLQESSVLKFSQADH